MKMGGRGEQQQLSGRGAAILPQKEETDAQSPLICFSRNETEVMRDRFKAGRPTVLLAKNSCFFVSPLKDRDGTLKEDDNNHC